MITPADLKPGQYFYLGSGQAKKWYLAIGIPVLQANGDCLIESFTTGGSKQKVLIPSGKKAKLSTGGMPMEFHPDKLDRRADQLHSAAVSLKRLAKMIREG